MATPKLYKNQALSTTTIANMDLSPAVEVKIMYKTPSGTTGEWTADSVSGKSALYFIPTNILSERGEWTRWLRVTFPGNRVYYSTPVKWFVNEIGS
jgi:hypothetical protein